MGSESEMSWSSRMFVQVKIPGVTWEEFRVEGISEYLSRDRNRYYAHV